MTNRKIGTEKPKHASPQQDGAANREKLTRKSPVRCIVSENEEKTQGDGKATHGDGKATHGEASVKRPNPAFAARMWALVRENAILRKKLVELEGENAMLREKYE